jgi:hypothetical protein
MTHTDKINFIAPRRCLGQTIASVVANDPHHCRGSGRAIFEGVCVCVEGRQGSSMLDVGGGRLVGSILGCPFTLSLLDICS